MSILVLVHVFLSLMIEGFGEVIGGASMHNSGPLVQTTDTERLRSDVLRAITLNNQNHFAECVQLLDRSIPALPVDGISSVEALVAYGSCLGGVGRFSESAWRSIGLWRLIPTHPGPGLVSHNWPLSVQQNQPQRDLSRRPQPCLNSPKKIGLTHRI